jgi:hypothetical protein
MTLPTTNSFADIILEVDTGSGFVAVMCGITNKGVRLSAATSAAMVPDCTDPEAPAWDVVGVSGLSAQVQISGVAAAEDEDLWNQWFDDGLAKAVRYRKEGVGYREGDMVLTDLGETVVLKQDGNLVQRSVTLQSASAFPWTSGDPS